MEVYMDEKWKLSKKGSRREHSRREQQQHQVQQHHRQPQQSLKRSSSMPESLKGMRNLRGSKSSKSTAPKNFSSRCANLVKEQRARFYIARRCVTMLICWRDYP